MSDLAQQLQADFNNKQVFKYYLWQEPGVSDLA